MSAARTLKASDIDVPFAALPATYNKYVDRKLIEAQSLGLPLPKHREETA